MGFSHDEKSKAGVEYPSIQGYGNSYQQPVFRPEMDYKYQGYHNPCIHHQAPNPNIIISNGAYYGPFDPHEHEKGLNCERILISLSVFLILFLCFICLIVWMLFGINLPEVEVSSLYVPSFNTTPSIIAGEWKANVSIRNPNEKYQLDFDNMKASVYFKDILLAEAHVGTLHLTPEEQISVYSELETKKLGASLTEEIMTELEQERTLTRSITFSLRLIGNSTLSSPSSRKSANVKIYCEGLTVDFLSSGIGNMTQTAADCLLYPS